MRYSRPAALAITALLAVMLLPGAAAGKQRTKWLCRPGLDDNPCRTGLRTSRVSPAGDPFAVAKPRRSRQRKLDCFYVYPTVSDQPTVNANRRIDPELRSIALYQAARYSQRCRVFAPVYRQVTLAGLDLDGLEPKALEVAYRDVRRAWFEYNRRYRRPGRGVVLIGHSQGTFMLERLIAERIDPRRRARRRVVVALLLGGNVTVRRGGDTGGSFEHLRACRSATQLHCVVAFSTFNDAVPENAVFGRTDAKGEEVLCTNPARLGGGGANLRSIYPSEPFAPGTSIGLATGLIGVPTPAVRTPFYQSRSYRGRCSSAGGADVLQISARPGAPVLRPIPDASWGLHLADANIALGDLTNLVRKQARRFVRRHRQPS